jgi:hypothetical protein
MTSRKETSCNGLAPSGPAQDYWRCERTLVKARESDRRNAKALLVNILDVEDDKGRKDLFDQGRVP